MPIDWNLLGPPVDVGAKIREGYDHGMAVRKQVATEHALAAYATDPTNPTTLSALASLSPEFAYKIGTQRAEQAATLAERQRVGAYFKNPDLTAARTQALQGGELDVAKQIENLSTEQQQHVAAFHKAVAPYAYKLKRLPKGPERTAYFEQAKSILLAEGADPQAMASFDPNNDTQLDAFITQGQTVQQLIDQGKIHYVQQGALPSFPVDAMGHLLGPQTGAQPPIAGGGFASAVGHVLGNEGGYSPSDMNGAPVNFGINQKANPGVDVKNLTRDQAVQIYHDRYWVPSGAEHLPANMQAPYFDVYIRNPSKAKEALAQSGGDPAKFMDITDHYFQTLATHPDGQKYGKAWANRDAKNRAIAMGTHVGAVTSKADFDALPSGTHFTAPDGSERIKP